MLYYETMYFHKYNKYINKLVGSGIFDESVYPYQSITQLDISKIKYLNGVASFEILRSDTKNINIILLGDIHVYTTTGFNSNDNESAYCPDYLENLFRKFSDLKFDIMVELNYNTDNIIPVKQYGFIENMRRKFYPCLNNLTDKELCVMKFPNTRFHAIDIRYWGSNVNPLNRENIKNKNKLQFFIFNMRNSNTYLENTSNYFNNNLQYIHKNKYKYIEIYHEIINKLNFLESIMSFDPEYFANKIINLLFTNYKFKRYTSRIVIFVNEYIKMKIINALNINKIINFYHKKINNHKKFLEIESSLDAVPVKYIYNLFKYINSIYFFIIDLSAILFDYYMLLRFTKIMDYQINDSTNLILIAGERHIKSFRNFIFSYNSYFNVKTPRTMENIYQKKLELNIIRDINKLIHQINKSEASNLKKINNKFVYSLRELKYFIDDVLSHVDDIISRSDDSDDTDDTDDTDYSQFIGNTYHENVLSYKIKIANLIDEQKKNISYLSHHPENKFVKIDDLVISLLDKYKKNEI